jgi:hypothetical protein
MKVLSRYLYYLKSNSFFVKNAIFLICSVAALKLAVKYDLRTLLFCDLS